MADTRHIIGNEVYRLVLDYTEEKSTYKFEAANSLLERRYGSISGARSTRGQLRSLGVHCHIERAVITWERVD